MIALSNNLFGCVKVLLKCSISPIGQGLLAMAAKSQNCGIVQDLIEDGVDYDGDALKYVTTTNMLRVISKHKHFNINHWHNDKSLGRIQIIQKAVSNMDTELFNFIVDQNCEMHTTVTNIIDLYKRNTDKSQLFMKKSLLKLRENNKLDYSTRHMLKIAHNLLFYRYAFPLQIFLSACVNYAMVVYALENDKNAKDYKSTIENLKAHASKCHTKIAATGLYKPLVNIIYEYTLADS